MATPPDLPTDGASKPPAPRKPATPRKTVRKTAASATPKPDARKADSVAASASSDAKPASSQAAASSSATAAAKTPAPRKRAASARKPAAAKSAVPRKAPAKSATRATAAKSTEREPTGTGTGRRWGIAAAVTAAGAAVTAGILALRGSTPVKDDLTKQDVAKPNEGKTAHQADGTDSSKSFEAGIADEGTIPE